MLLLSAWYVSCKLGNHPEICLKPQKAAQHFCWGLAQLLTSLVYSLDAWPQKVQLFEYTSSLVGALHTSGCCLAQKYVTAVVWGLGV